MVSIKCGKNNNMKFIKIKLMKCMLCLKFISNQTEDLCLKIIKNFPSDIEYVKNQTDKICFLVLEQNTYLINCIKQPTQKMYDFVVNENPVYFKYVDKKFYTYDMCLNVVKKHGGFIVRIPNKLWDETLCLAALKNNPCIIKFITDEQLTDKIILKLAKYNTLEKKQLH